MAGSREVCQAARSPVDCPVTGLIHDCAYLLCPKAAVPVVLLALFWCWETWRPFFAPRGNRSRHAVHNLAIALFNTIVLGLVFGSSVVLLAELTHGNRWGFLHALDLPAAVRFGLALLLLDGWMYIWHRLNHAVPVLWRFHRMHHSDPYMDVTTATRFHLGEHGGGALIRLGQIPLLGLEIEQLIAYDTLVLAITQFHHANISIGRYDGWLRLLVVTPDMHKVHHSDQQPETDSNYSTVLSLWDRLAGTFRMRSDPGTIVFGLPEFISEDWQRCWGLWKTPFVDPPTSPMSDDADRIRPDCTNPGLSPVENISHRSIGNR
jgi:sterol desaturase/sphingolipid hydroxylase (fatty acid hydroxylase superfamily)